MLPLTYVLTDDYESEIRAFPISGNYTLSSQACHSGTRSLSNVLIYDGQTTSFTITINLPAAAPISFWYLCSSEGGYDRLRFYINGAIKIDTGNSGWLKYASILPTGKSVLTFTYSKDGSASSGYDRFFIDELTVNLFDIDIPTLLFTNEVGSPYNRPNNEVFQTLDFGNLLAGQVSLPQKVNLNNYCGFDVTNVRIIIKPPEFPPKITIEVSQFNSPFIPEETNVYNGVIKDGESISFYVRVLTQEDTMAGGDFNIYAKADPL